MAECTMETDISDINLLKSTKILVYVEEALQDLLVVSFAFDSKFFQGILLDSTKRWAHDDELQPVCFMIIVSEIYVDICFLRSLYCCTLWTSVRYPFLLVASQISRTSELPVIWRSSSINYNLLILGVIALTNGRCLLVADLLLIRYWWKN